jgi:hypothetical protein
VSENRNGQELYTYEEYRERYFPSTSAQRELSEVPPAEFGARLAKRALARLRETLCDLRLIQG